MNTIPAAASGHCHLCRRAPGDKPGPKIVIAQAGQINTGAFDPFTEIVPLAKARGAWVHVDGAFGLWARAAPSRDDWVMRLSVTSGATTARDIEISAPAIVAAWRAGRLAQPRGAQRVSPLS